LAGVCENVGLARAEAADYRRTLTDIAQELEKAGIPAHVNVPGLTITYGLSDRVEQLAGQRDAALAELAALKGQVESMRPVVEAVRELLAAKVAMLSAISADFMSEARLKYLRKLSKVESLDLPPKEQP
jgi:hypothetical protein